MQSQAQVRQGREVSLGGSSSPLSERPLAIASPSRVHPATTPGRSRCGSQENLIGKGK